MIHTLRSQLIVLTVAALSWVAGAGSAEATVNQPPTAVSVTPSSGAGSNQTFSFVFSDPNGFADLSTAYMGFNSSFSFVNGCYSYYDQNANALFLLSDNGGAWYGPVTPGSGAILQNNDCTLNAAGSSVSGSGNNLTVNLALTFSAHFFGAKNIYMCALDKGGLSSGWQPRGTWMAPVLDNEPPGADSVTPASGSGLSQTFGLVYSDPNGFADLATTYVVINSTFSFPGSCSAYYDRSANALWLINDAANGWLGPMTPGAGTLQNGQCILSGAGSSVSGSGNTLTVNLALSFMSGFGGVKNVYMCALDNGALSSGWQQRGGWTVPVPNNQPPSTVSVTPSSGSGSSQTFSFVFSDPNGFTDLFTTYIGFSSTFAFGNACYSYYDRGANALWLLNNAANAWLGPVPPGSSGTLQNNQCALSAAGSSVSGSGNNLTVNLALTFKVPFAGAKNVYMSAQDNSLLSTGWQQFGTWTVPVPNNQPPAAVSVTPSSGSGSNQTFSFVFSDPNGFADLSTTYMGFNSSFSFANGCYSYYDQNANTLWLLDDRGGYWQGPVTPGSAATLQNNDCTLHAAGSSVSGSGNNLTVNLALTFYAPFFGAKNIYMCALDNGGASSNWQQQGTWMAPVLVNEPPTADSVTPASGSGSSQTFTLVYSDPNGFTDLSTTYVTINSTFNFPGSCSSYYDRNANALWLFNDAANAWLGPMTPGGAGTLQNGQCVLSGAGSSVSGSGNTLTVNLALSFMSGFGGVKNIYICALDNSGLSSNWQQRGGWTVPVPNNQPPSAVSVTPPSGSGTSQTFSFVFSDPNGFADLFTTYIGFSSTFAFGNACYSYYDRDANTLWLLNNAANAWLGPMTPGAAGTLQNTQCALNGAGSSVSGSNNNLTVNLALTFKVSFAGAKNVYMDAQDNSLLSSGWQQLGTWTVPIPNNQPPTTVSVTPASGAGSNQTFSFVFSDPNGFADLSTAYMGFNSSFSFVNGCYSYYDQNANALFLLSDNGGAWYGPVTPGSAATLDNFYCTLHAAGSSVSASGNNLTVNLALTFRSSFFGAKNIYMSTLDNSGASSDWQQRGTWTAQ